MTAAQEARAALRTLADTCAQASQDLEAFRVRRGDDEFAVLHARLAAVGRAVGALPRRLTSLEPAVPWREFECLPALLARPDIRRDWRILDVTLASWLRRLGKVAGAINMAVADDPDLLHLDR